MDKVLGTKSWPLAIMLLQPLLSFQKVGREKKSFANQPSLAKQDGVHLVLMTQFLNEECNAI